MDNSIAPKQLIQRSGLSYRREASASEPALARTGIDWLSAPRTLSRSETAGRLSPEIWQQRCRRLPQDNVWIVWLMRCFQESPAPHDDFKTRLSGALSGRRPADAVRRWAIYP